MIMYEWKAAREIMGEPTRQLGTFATKTKAKGACVASADVKLHWINEGKAFAYAPDPARHYTTFTVTRIRCGRR